MLRWLIGETITLVLTDVVMPEMKGRVLSDRLRAAHPKVKTLFLSGYTAAKIASQGALDEGVADLQQPVTRRELAVMVREALGR